MLWEQLDWAIIIERSVISCHDGIQGESAKGLSRNNDSIDCAGTSSLSGFDTERLIPTSWTLINRELNQSEECYPAAGDEGAGERQEIMSYLLKLSRWKSINFAETFFFGQKFFRMKCRDHFF